MIPTVQRYFQADVSCQARKGVLRSKSKVEVVLLRGPSGLLKIPCEVFLVHDNLLKADTQKIRRTLSNGSSTSAKLVDDS